MRIELRQVGKRYKTEWILRQVTLQLDDTHAYAITGPNGSGKSTLLRILSGHLTPSRGSIAHYIGARTLPADELYRHLAYAAPYIDLIEEFTLLEALRFHQQFKPFLEQRTPHDLLAILGLESARNKPLRQFSSGMKQRLKLALAICSNADLLLLDEPTATLDRQGITWYQELMQQFTPPDRLTIVASNVEEDFFCCETTIAIPDFK